MTHHLARGLCAVEAGTRDAGDHAVIASDSDVGFADRRSAQATLTQRATMNNDEVFDLDNDGGAVGQCRDDLRALHREGNDRSAEVGTHRDGTVFADKAQEAIVGADDEAGCSTTADGDDRAGRSRQRCGAFGLVGDVIKDRDRGVTARAFTNDAQQARGGSEGAGRFSVTKKNGHRSLRGGVGRRRRCGLDCSCGAAVDSVDGAQRL